MSLSDRQSDIPHPVHTDSAPLDEDVQPNPVRLPELDDIKVEYHPSSGRSTRIFPFAEFKQEWPEYEHLNTNPEDPFQSRDDFDFAEAVLEARMKKPQIEAILKVMRRIHEGRSEFSLWTHRDLMRTWEEAEKCHPAVSYHTYKALIYLMRGHSSRSTQSLFRSGTRHAPTMSIHETCGIGSSTKSQIHSWPSISSGMRNVCSNGMVHDGNGLSTSRGQLGDCMKYRHVLNTLRYGVTLI